MIPIFPSSPFTTMSTFKSISIKSSTIIHIAFPAELWVSIYILTTTIIRIIPEVIPETPVPVFSIPVVPEIPFRHISSPEFTVTI
eukprot:Pgem_evm1s12045